MNCRDSEQEPMDTEDSNQNMQDNQNNCLDNEKMERKKKRKLNKEEERENLVTSGNLFIIAFMKLLQKTEAPKNVACHYLERVLHSIFFFGYINIPKISPEEFIPEEMFDKLRNYVPKPFNEYNTHLPYYTPYSILLEYMNESLKPEDPDLFLTELVAINKSFWKNGEGNQPIANDFALTASVVTYCCRKDASDAKVLKKAYGSSMSCKGKVQRKIMIAISTLHVWDKAISYVVCCKGNSPPIKFPEQVHCCSYRLQTQQGGYKKIPPCNKCKNMLDAKFCPEHQAHNKKEDWMYGNCAESESFSRLLQSDKSLREKICMIDDNLKTQMNWDDLQNKFKEKYEEKKKKKVKTLLSSRNFKLSSEEWKFFIPYHSL